MESLYIDTEKENNAKTVDQCIADWLKEPNVGKA